MPEAIRKIVNVQVSTCICHFLDYDVYFLTLKRYYGESLPFGSESFEHDKIGYLAVEQAMADYAVLITELKVQLNATKSKVVAFGGR